MTSEYIKGVQEIACDMRNQMKSGMQVAQPKVFCEVKVKEGSSHYVMDVKSISANNANIRMEGEFETHPIALNIVGKDVCMVEKDREGRHIIDCR